MSASVVVDFATELPFPDKENGDLPKIEHVRNQVSAYAEGYHLAKRRPPERIVMAPGDLKHVLRRIVTRINRGAVERKRVEFDEMRKAGKRVKWRDVRPESLKACDAALNWGGIPIEASAGYTRHRPVDRS